MSSSVHVGVRRRGSCRARATVVLALLATAAGCAVPDGPTEKCGRSTSSGLQSIAAPPELPAELHFRRVVVARRANRALAAAADLEGRSAVAAAFELEHGRLMWERRVPRASPDLEIELGVTPVIAIGESGATAVILSGASMSLVSMDSGVSMGSMDVASTGPWSCVDVSERGEVVVAVDFFGAAFSAWAGKDSRQVRPQWCAVSRGEYTTCAALDDGGKWLLMGSSRCTEIVDVDSGSVVARYPGVVLDHVAPVGVGTWLAVNSAGEFFNVGVDGSIRRDARGIVSGAVAMSDHVVVRGRSNASTEVSPRASGEYVIPSRPFRSQSVSVGSDYVAWVEAPRGALFVAGLAGDQDLRVAAALDSAPVAVFTDGREAVSITPQGVCRERRQLDDVLHVTFLGSGFVHAGRDRESEMVILVDGGGQISSMTRNLVQVQLRNSVPHPCVAASSDGCSVWLASARMPEHCVRGELDGVAQYDLDAGESRRAWVTCIAPTGRRTEFVEGWSDGRVTLANLETGATSVVFECGASVSDLAELAGGNIAYVTDGRVCIGPTSAANIAPLEERAAAVLVLRGRLHVLLDNDTVAEYELPIVGSALPVEVVDIESWGSELNGSWEAFTGKWAEALARLAVRAHFSGDVDRGVHRRALVPAEVEFRR